MPTATFVSRVSTKCEKDRTAVLCECKWDPIVMPIATFMSRRNVCECKWARLFSPYFIPDMAAATAKRSDEFQYTAISLVL